MTSEPRVPARLRQQVHTRARGVCEYCRGQAQFALQPFSVEHIAPRSRGGPTEAENLALACPGCNAHKYNKVEGVDPVSGELVALHHPRRERWRDHFAWSPDFTLIVGLTATGRATVEELRMNRDGAVNLRRLLYAAGAHPPEEPGE